MIENDESRVEEIRRKREKIKWGIPAGLSTFTGAVGMEVQHGIVNGDEYMRVIGDNFAWSAFIMTAAGVALIKVAESYEGKKKDGAEVVGYLLITGAGLLAGLALEPTVSRAVGEKFKEIVEAAAVVGAGTTLITSAGVLVADRMIGNGLKD